MGTQSEAHLEWLVKHRSANQARSLEIYKLLSDYPKQLRTNHSLGNSAQLLVGVSFSLWRAVFLCDTQLGLKDVVGDAESFLEKLILDNAVAYPQDRAAREWTCLYYLTNAAQRLIRLTEGPPSLLPKGTEHTVRVGQPRETWEKLHKSLGAGIERLRELLEAEPVRAKPRASKIMKGAST